MEKKEAWWERPLMIAVAAGLLLVALWANFGTASRESNGFIPPGYSEQDVDHVRVAARAVLDCWLAQESIGCFSDGLDTESPFLWDMLDRFNAVPAYHRIGQPYEVDTKTLGTLMNMDWPEEERRDFANSRDFRRDGMVIVFVTSTDLSFLELCWREQLCEGCALPHLKQRKMAEVRTVIKPANGLPGTSVVLYLLATETRWSLFDWQTS